ncbi:hypothetical protein MTP03_25240 [Tsukamurella sp. PLM1]|nr:hypothetical protein MTP03_25240 [Tsukamurella sp. PLM1]
MSSPAPTAEHPPVVGQLSTLDRFLPVWIGVAMAAGLLLGRMVPGLNTALEKINVDGISLPIALGLLVMMYPVLAKVRYDRLGTVTGDRALLLGSLVLNWVLGPALMFALAWIFLPDLPEYRTGLIIVGLARCIAMVIIWNDLACGDREAAAVLVALNSVFQVVMFAVLGWFYLSILPGWLGLEQTTIETSPWQIARSVLIFLGIPLLAGYLSRRIGERAKGRAWYEATFLPRIGPWALYGLLFTIVILFALQGADHFAPLGRRTDRVAPVGVLRGDVGRRVPAGSGHGPGVRAHHHAGVHRGGQQLRARHRGRDRHVRRHVGPGPGRRRRAADRGAGAGRPGVRVTCPPQAIPGKGGVMSTPSVLFVCVKNGGKSQMAAGLMRRAAGGAVEVHSAGTRPGSAVNGLSAEALAEVGVDITGETPKAIDPELLARVDLVVTLGREAVVEVPDGTRLVNWDTDEPSERGVDGIERMRLVRDDIARRVAELADEFARRG